MKNIECVYKESCFIYQISLDLKTYIRWKNLFHEILINLKRKRYLETWKGCKELKTKKKI